MVFCDVIVYMEYVCVCFMILVVDQDNNNKFVYLSKLVCFKKKNKYLIFVIVKIKYDY